MKGRPLQSRLDKLFSPPDLEAYRLGVHEQRLGRNHDDNPYPSGAARLSWYMGWYESRHEAKFGWPKRWE